MKRIFTVLKPLQFVGLLQAICIVGLFLINSYHTAAQNYILTRTYKNGVAGEASDVSKTTTEIQYFDGLGRPVQRVNVRQSPSGNDLIVLNQYDAFGREVNQYLPFTDVGTPGSLRTNAASLQSAFYSANIPQFSPSDVAHPYQETLFEDSPLNRVFGVKGAGGNSILTDIQYGVNDATQEHSVKRYDFQDNVTLTQTVQANGNYANGELTYVKHFDESGVMTLEFKDKNGRVVLKRGLDNVNYLDTYYVYDDLGQLRAVLQPMYQTEANAQKYAFLYRYDNRGRMIEKQIPGAEKVEMVYDQYDRLVLSRDGNQRNRGVWSFIKYDELNRPVLTGEIINNQSFSYWETELASNGHHEQANGTGEIYYTLTNTLPNITAANVLTVTYYDAYGAWALAYDSRYGLSTVSNLKGLSTGGRSRILKPDGTYGDTLLTHTTYFDDNYRPIQQAKKIFGFGGSNENVLRISTNYKYAIAAVTANETEDHAVDVGAVKIEKTYIYDHSDRLLKVKHQVWRNNAAQPQINLAAMNYNELGQLKNKWLHSINDTLYRRKVAYEYNIKGWQTEARVHFKKQDNPNELTQFKYNLSYWSFIGYYSNGNISTMSWQHANATGAPEAAKNANFSYDGANRLYDTSTGSTVSKEGNIQYDLNGNLKALKRWRGNTLIDNLTYTYTDGNRLAKIDDATANTNGFKDAAGTDYAYDANGNLTQDGNKGIAAGDLKYNVLNLVRKISLGSNTLEYHYDASGQKHQLQYSKPSAPSQNETTRYVGSVEWQGSTLKRIATGEGQWIASLDTNNMPLYRYHYYLTDHLGNVRLVVDEKGTLIQKADYYPFGLAIPLSTGTTDSLRLANKYLYNGKELQPETGLLDYGARMYDGAVGRFFTLDRFSEKYADVTGYHYGANNPILYIDVNGDSLSITPSFSDSWVLGEAFKLFSNTQEGRSFLSKFARKGQTINGYTFKDDGEYHKKGINLIYDTFIGDSGLKGRVYDNNEDQNIPLGTIVVYVNNNNGIRGNQIDDKSFTFYDPNKTSVQNAETLRNGIFSRTITLFHESFLHAEISAKDYYDNRILDNSSKPGYTNDHYFVKDRDTNAGLFPGAAYRGMIKVNSRTGNHYTSQNIEYAIWNYYQGKNIGTPFGSIKKK